VGRRPAKYELYPQAQVLERDWRALVAEAGGREAEVGRSVQGRPLWRFDLGCKDESAPTIFLTALIHGVEVIGSLALLDAVRTLVQGKAGLLDRHRVVLMPIANPDALAYNMDRLDRGRGAGRRKNARGVDLNRNFPPIGEMTTRPWHPFSGSRFPFMPHHSGPHPLSEPESRAIAEVAAATQPKVALGFHSFGNMLLYPWGHTRAPNPRTHRYQGLVSAFSEALVRTPYRCGQAINFYPTVGDLDDWLDARFGTLALTVEVGALDRRLYNPRRLLNAFCWMNPSDVEGTVRNVTPGVLGLLGSKLVGI
jgi:carboxypeptidase T